jgi:hypothetical protein
MKNINRYEIAAIQALEESLWRPETRFDHAYMDRILAPDFLEFGRSGRIYNRAEVLTVPYMEIHCALPLMNFAVHPLAEGIVFTTYISEVLNGELQLANRSSIWIKSPTGWQIQFHQGTPFIQV